jgi:hypothetical protein
VTILLIVVLLTAVFQSQRSRSSLIRYDADKEIAREAALSVLEYGRFRLEQQQTWLVEEPIEFVPPLTPSGKPLFVVDRLERQDENEDEEEPASFVVTMDGTLHAEQQVEFSMLITNNLANDTGDLGLGPHSSSLDVTTRFGTSKVRHVWVLRHAAFSNSTVAASGNIEMETETVAFSSTDSSRNQIRSMSNIYLPDAEQLEFNPGGGWQRQEKGTVWAHDDIRIGPEDDPTPLGEAAEETGAQFIPNGRSAYRVPKLKVEDVGADLELDEHTLMPSGVYRVGTTTLTVQDTSGTIHEKAIPVVQQGEIGDSPSIRFVESQLQDGLPPLDLTTIRLASDPDEPVFAQPSSSANVKLGPLEAFLLQDEPCRMTLPAKQRVVCEGSLEISGFSSGDLPVLEFKSKTTDPNEKVPRGYLECKGGELAIACHLENAGMLMASGDVSIYPADVKVEASLSSDLAVFAGGDVNIDPRLAESSLEEVGDDGRKLAFRGLIYAGGDVNFDTVSDHKTKSGNAIYFNRDIEIEGSVVARGGKVSIIGEYGAELRYNPDFLDDVMESSLSSKNRQLEIVSAREM